MGRGKVGVRGQDPRTQPYSRTVRIGMISVVPEEEEEDINMESYGEEGYEHEYNGEEHSRRGLPDKGKKKATDSGRTPPLIPSQRIQWK
jgi:hypothetical protein